MSHGILVIKITRWIGIGWREGYQPNPCLEDISRGLCPLCAKWSLNTVREQLQLFSVLISPDSGFFFTFSVFPENTVHNQYILYTVPVRTDFFIPMFWGHTHVQTVHICLSPLQRCYIFSNEQSTTAIGQSLRAPSHNSTHVLICSRTVRGSSHGQSDHTLGQSVCDSWQSITISSWPTSSVTLTVYVCFMVIS